MSRVYTEVLIYAESLINTAGVMGGVGGAINVSSQATEYGFYVEFDGTSAAGQVVIETASSPTYSGTWAILATVNWAAINKCHYVALTNALRCVRARIAIAVTDGAVTVTGTANVP